MVVLYFSCKFDVVVQRGDPCLCTMPSWLEVFAFIFLYKEIFIYDSQVKKGSGNKTQSHKKDPWSLGERKGRDYLRGGRDAFVGVGSRLWSEEVTECCAEIGVQESSTCCHCYRSLWTSEGGESTWKTRKKKLTVKSPCRSLFFLTPSCDKE